jgi:peptidoglycan/LPS O-acetylase OafA/YrhL
LKTKKITAMILAWFLGVLASAGILALFQNPADESYWSTLAVSATILLAVLAAIWVRNDRPKRAHALWAMTAVLIIPARVLTFSLGPVTALGGLIGGLIAALIIIWPNLVHKESAPRVGH